MEQEYKPEGKVVTWDEVNFGGNYVKFEEDKRHQVIMHNWGLYEREGKNYNTKEPEKQIFFEAQVLNFDGDKTLKILSTSSKPFLKSVKAIVTGKDPKKPLQFTVKRIGTGASTVYDMELPLESL